MPYIMGYTLSLSRVLTGAATVAAADALLTEDGDVLITEDGDELIYEDKVDPFISRKDEYLLFKKALKNKILPSKEMEEIEERNLLKARVEAIILLKDIIDSHKNESLNNK
ncbi:hypothetical protein LCGC14_2923710 [marine sediment metagenome]|uniref:Uncharacterized protein n=1 Tax=marine sediment metagenome TaxID=412755 RepID=A0A0F8Y9X0_9ZZZZ